MSLQVTCPGCKKKLAVKQELLGKKIKCSGCQTMLALAAPKTPQAAAPRQSAAPVARAPQPKPQRKSPASKGDSLLIACRCGTKLRVPTSARGKQVRCSSCQATLKVPAAKPSPAAAVAGAAAAPQPSPLGDGFPAFDQNGFGAAPADPALAADGFGAPAADGFGAPAGGGDLNWDALPSAGAAVPGVNPLPAAQPAPARGGAGRGNEALANAGAFKPSLEEKIGATVAATTQVGGGFWEYINNRVHMLILLMMFGGPIITYAGWMTKNKLTALETEGVTVPGLILSGEERRGRKGSRSYSFLVQYVPKDGTPLMDEFSVSSSFFHAHISGDEIGNDACEVTYRPDDPEEAIVVGGSTDSVTTLYIGIVATILGICGFAFTMVVGPITFLE